MEKVTLSFSAKGQSLRGCPFRFASNTVNYIEAKFELCENWGGFDSVRAVWFTDFNCISTVLDTDGVCVVPHEVLNKAKREVKVNLVGSIVENGELTDRLTTYPIKAIIIDANAKICGSETAEVTPSQFEQYIAIVEQLVGSVKDIDHTTLNADYTLTIYYTDGTSDTVGPIRGAQGETGNGILSAVLNPDYTLTLNYTNGQHDTVGPIRGAKGETGNGIQSVYLTGTSGAVKTYTILFTDGNTTEFQVTDGEVTNAVLESLMPTDTANGSIASFPDGQNVFPLKSLVADIDPIQDLNGYDAPWVGGAGKNKFPPFPSYTASGITFTANADGSTTITGSATANVNNILDVDIPSGTYTLSLNMTGESINARFRFMDENNTSMQDIYLRQVNSVVTITVSSVIKHIRCTIANGATDINITVKPQLESGSSATSFAPYENICPISGHTEVGVSVAGKNLLKNTVSSSSTAGVTYTVNDDKTISLSGTATSNAFIVLSDPYYLSSGTHTMKKSGNQTIQMLLRAGTPAGANKIVATTNDATSVIDEGTYVGVIRIASGTNTDGITLYPQLELGSTATAYEPYNGQTYTTQLGQTVYGGTLDLVSGVLTVTHGVLNLGDLNWTYTSSNQNMVGNTPSYMKKETVSAIADILCSIYATGNVNQIYSGSVDKQIGEYNGYILVRDTSYTDASVFKTAMNGVQLCYELATPTTYQLTPQQIQTLIGQNNVWADSGDVEVVYIADIKLYVDNH